MNKQKVPLQAGTTNNSIPEESKGESLKEGGSPFLFWCLIVNLNRNIKAFRFYVMAAIKSPLSQRDKRNIKKAELIIKLLHGTVLIEAKQILAAVSNHLDSSSVIDKSQYQLNVKPVLKNF